MKNTISEDGRISNEPRCPNQKCNQIINGFTDMEGDRKPSPEDVSICLYCAELLMFDENLNLVFYPTNKWVDLPLDERKYLDGLVSDVMSEIKAKAFRKILNKKRR